MTEGGDNPTPRKRVRGADIRIPPEAEVLLLDADRLRSLIVEARRALRSRRNKIAGDAAAELNERTDRPPTKEAVAIFLNRCETIHRSELAHLAADVIAAEREWARWLKKLDRFDLGEGLGHIPEAVDITAFYDGERGLSIRVGGKSFDLVLPIPIDRGVWREGVAYTRGDVVTQDGSLWIAQGPNIDSKPGMGPAWRLSVVRGKNGRDGKSGRDFTKPTI